MPRRRRPPRPGAMAELPPLRIAGQIVTLQALYYTTALVLMLFTTLVAGAPFSFGLIFGWEAVRGDTTQGWLCAFIWMLDGGLCMAMAVIVLISRSKLVPDFAATIHGVHLMVTVFYTRSIPRNLMWWATMFASTAACIGLGIWGSQYRELNAVFFGGGGNGTAAAASNSNTAPPLGTEEGVTGGSRVAENGGPAEDHGDEEQGFARGRGRGRGRDGGGQYEMVGLKGENSHKGS